MYVFDVRTVLYNRNVKIQQCSMERMQQHENQKWPIQQRFANILMCHTVALSRRKQEETTQI
jgi:hypothetical protein